MRLTYPLIATLIAIGTAGSHASAADVGVSDLRLFLGIMPNEFDGASSISTTSGGVTTSGSAKAENSDSNYRGGLQFMFGRLGDVGGFLVGLEAAVIHTTFNRTAGDTTVTTPVADLFLGYGIAPTEQWHIELTPFAGIGASYFQTQNNNSTDASYDDVYSEYGIRAATYYTFPSRWQVGVDLRYVVSQTNPEFDYTTAGTNTVNVRQDLENHGFAGFVSVGRRF